jgi:hypothetical protein
MRLKNKLMALAFVVMGALMFTQFDSLAAQEKEQPTKSQINKEETIIGTVVKVDSALFSRTDSLRIEKRAPMNKIAIAVTKESKNDGAKAQNMTEHYFVDDNEQGRKLESLIGQKVQVTGAVQTDNLGHQTIKVSKYTVIDSDKTTKKY